MKKSDIVGVWEVNAPDAPFAWHVMTFTPFGTMLQSNPPAGNISESDSAGHGIWREVSENTYEAKFLEFKASHETGEFLGKGVISLRLKVTGDMIKGVSEARSYDASGKLISGPHGSPISGKKLEF